MNRSIFSHLDYRQMADLFHPHHKYAGYKPDVKESPNGDGKIDGAKRYLHIALKYDPPAWALDYLARAHFEACKTAERLRVPDAYYPRVENGTLRVLEYPIGSDSHEHTDFDLFTVNCFRDGPGCEAFVQTCDTEFDWLENPFEHHVGKIGTIVGMGHSTPHRVIKQDRIQKAIVYFAMPAMAAVLPTGETVKDWLDKEYAKTRY